MNAAAPHFFFAGGCLEAPFSQLNKGVKDAKFESTGFGYTSIYDKSMQWYLLAEDRSGSTNRSKQVGNNKTGRHRNDNDTGMTEATFFFAPCC